MAKSGGYLTQLEVGPIWKSQKGFRRNAKVDLRPPKIFRKHFPRMFCRNQNFLIFPDLTMLRAPATLLSKTFKNLL